MRPLSPACNRGHMHQFRRFTLVVSCVVCAALSLWFHDHVSTRPLEIFFLDVGQGDAIYVRTPMDHDMLIDGGRSVSVLRRLSEVMSLNDRHIDVLLETHPDADHIGGFPSVLERYSVGVFVEPGIESLNAIDDEIRRLRAERGVGSVIARRGMRIDFGDGVTFDVLYPLGNTFFVDDPNGASIIGRLVYGSSSVMLTGDAPKSSEAFVVSLDADRARSDILKAGHHGSRTSSGESFVSAVDPDWVIFSVGKNNTYRHPHDEVVSLFERRGIEVLRTDELGTIEFESRGEFFQRK